MEHAIKRHVGFEEGLHECFWYIILSNGETIYRNDVGTKDSWLIAKDYLCKNNLSIVNMGIKFRDHYEGIGENKKAYFFCKMVKGIYGSDLSEHYYVAGYLTDDKKHFLTRTYKLPELIVQSEEYRAVDSPTLDYRSVYWNPQENTSQNSAPTQI